MPILMLSFSNLSALVPTPSPCFLIMFLILKNDMNPARRSSEPLNEAKAYLFSSCPCSCGLADVADARLDHHQLVPIIPQLVYKVGITQTAIWKYWG